MDERGALAILRRIATHAGARGLADDAALIDGLVLTHDSIAEGIHFLPDDPPASVGWKLVAVNLSDLAAKGATPLAALLSLTLAGEDEWVEGFLGGVAAACETYGLALVGGDSIALPPGAARVLGMTAIGRAGPRTPSRAGGGVGDRLWLAGTLGDSAAGLAQLLSDPRAIGPLVERYRRPMPLLAAGQALATVATATMDVSDGLLIDVQRLCAASGCGARIALDRLPLSADFEGVQGTDRNARLFAATGGDDYAILAALPADLDPGLSLCLPTGTKVTAIGFLEPGDALALTDGDGTVELPERLGHEHHS